MDEWKEQLAKMNPKYQRKERPKSKKSHHKPRQHTATPSKKRNLSPNLGWLFYKDYFRAMDSEEIEKTIKNKIDNLLAQRPLLPRSHPLKKIANASFRLKSLYPGLLLGSGYPHELPDVKEQAILGFDFDYTTGLPIIRGSSIKGVLRSAFEHKEYIQELLDTKIDIEELEKEIFENGDIFFDALIVGGEEILADDYLAPHGELYEEPTPLRFIKVAPGVEFEFLFLLKDGIVSKEEKKDLFKQILLDLGLGAKTSVGYGRFEEVS